MEKKIANISKAFLDDLETLLLKHENILTKKYKGKEIEWTDPWEGGKRGIVDSVQICENCDGEWEFLFNMVSEDNQRFVYVVDIVATNE